MRTLTEVVGMRGLLPWSLLVVLVPACSESVSSPVSPTTAQPTVASLTVVGPSVVVMGSANLAISYEPDPVPGSLTPCTGAFWRGQTPTWSNVETIKETQGVGFTLKVLTYNFYNQDGVLTLTGRFQENHYFPPYDEHVEDGCMALGGSPSGSFEEIVEGVDDNGNQLKFVRKLRLLPVP
jgi:hypothetical protein